MSSPSDSPEKGIERFVSAGRQGEFVRYEDHAAALADQKQQLAEGMPDDSIGDVIAAKPDGTITLDDGITTWNPERACSFLLAEATRERDSLHEKWQEAERLCGVACEERDKAEADHDEAVARERERLRKALAEEKRSLIRSARLADEEGGDGSYYEHVIHGIERAVAALDSLEDGEARVDLGPERMRVVDAPDGGLDVVPDESEHP